MFKRYASKLVDEQKLNEEEFGCLRAMIASLMNISLGAYGKLVTQDTLLRLELIVLLWAHHRAYQAVDTGRGYPASPPQDNPPPTYPPRCIRLDISNMDRTEYSPKRARGLVLEDSGRVFISRSVVISSLRDRGGRPLMNNQFRSSRTCRISQQNLHHRTDRSACHFSLRIRPAVLRAVPDRGPAGR